MTSRGLPHRLPDMTIADSSPNGIVCDESEIYRALLPLDGATILELGCGRAEKTRAIATNTEVASITALEVDEAQQAINRQTNIFANVFFRLGGAEAIPCEDASFDIVLMFRSLHHVAAEKMDLALAEIHRVLKPGGLAYISEPVFAGDFNEILRLFHNEEQVREQAFAAIRRAVEGGRFTLEAEKFFHAPSHFDDFAHFEQRILNVTHTRHELAPALYDQVRGRFMGHMTPSGADFRTPVRVDLLRAKA